MRVELGPDELHELFHRPVLDRNGEKLGKLEDFFRDDRTGRPLWLEVRAGSIRHRVDFVPVEGAECVGGQVVIPFDRTFVQGAPTPERYRPMSEEDDARLASYYGVTPGP
ncbi:MAG TPA: PRC-barrel domain-containing protein [Acidimicrobiales bacterium]|nr:PRC-barrel domain-containing protein [Acidimicrobiales bacterium]